MCQAFSSIFPPYLYFLLLSATMCRATRYNPPVLIVQDDSDLEDESLPDEANAQLLQEVDHILENTGNLPQVVIDAFIENMTREQEDYLNARLEEDNRQIDMLIEKDRELGSEIESLDKILAHGAESLLEVERIQKENQRLADEFVSKLTEAMKRIEEYETQCARQDQSSCHDLSRPPHCETTKICALSLDEILLLGEH